MLQYYIRYCIIVYQVLLVVRTPRNSTITSADDEKPQQGLAGKELLAKDDLLGYGDKTVFIDHTLYMTTHCSYNDFRNEIIALN